MVDVVKRLRQTTPIQVHLVPLEPERAWRSVANADVDGAISIAELPQLSDGKVISYSLWRERFVLTVPMELQTLNVLNTNSGRPLDRVPWILPPARSVWDRLVGSFFHRLQIRPRVIGRSDEWSVIQQMAVDAFKAVDCSGLARIDFLMDPKSGKIFVNEINTMPGFTAISMYPKLWAASGVDYPDLISRLIELALERHAEKQRNQYSR